jgi:hypothetical protein
MEAGPRTKRHWVAWGIFMAAFVGAGAWPLVGLRHQIRVLDQSPTNSSDLIFTTNFDLPNGTRRIGECLEKVRPGERVAILFRLDGYQTAAAQIIAVAAWSRGCTSEFLSSEAADAREKVQRGKFGAVFYVDQHLPSWLAGAEKLSSSVAFARLSPRAP